jgi:DHA2 family multidrug resistance protein
MTIGFMALFATYITIVYATTPTTPTAVLAPMIFMQGFSVAPALVAAGNIVTSSATLADVNDISTSYFFVRQLGNTFAVTGATVLFDHRMTLHSSRLLDVANRLYPTLNSTLAQYAGLIHSNGGGGSNPSLGALQLFQNQVITQSRLLSYVDNYFGLALLAAVALIIIAFSNLKARLGRHHFLPW